MEYRVYSDIKDISLLDGSTDAKSAVYDLWRECFGDSTSYTDFYFNWKMKDNQVYTVFKGERIASMLHLNPYILSVGGKKITSNYIVGVATKEEDRRQGLMKLLLEKAMNQMNEEEMPFTYLMPAKEAIYLPFGFRIVYEQESFKQQIINTREEISLRGINAIMHEAIDTIILDSDNDMNLERIVDFTDQYLESVYDIFVSRDKYYYKRLIHEMHSSQGEVMLVLQNGMIIGYIAYVKENDLQVAEAIYLPHKKEEFWYGVTDRLSGFLSEEQILHNPPTIMARIINLNSFIAGITAIKETSLIIDVVDDIIWSNNGAFEVTFTQTGSKCTPTEKAPEIKGNISEFTKLFFGQDKEKLALSMLDQDNDIILEKLNNINYYSNVFINDVV
ncbi:MAG: hypothetical protein K0S61_616 [Anaerocolumna sp.]|jgi:predicted acetyltransferase|nr:hypothetical protein [Anaerocolumna sp.]